MPINQAIKKSMIYETGRVVALESDSLWVETIRSSTCNSCSAQKGCGHGILNKVANARRNYVRALLVDQSADDYHIDDEVEISIPEQVLVSGALLVYLMPLLSMLAGALLLSQWFASDFVQFIGAVAGFCLGLLFVRVHAFYHRDNVDYQPLVKAKLPVRGTKTLTLQSFPIS